MQEAFCFCQAMISQILKQELRDTNHLSHAQSLAASFHSHSGCHQYFSGNIVSQWVGLRVCVLPSWYIFFFLEQKIKSQEKKNVNDVWWQQLTVSMINLLFNGMSRFWLHGDQFKARHMESASLIYSIMSCFSLTSWYHFNCCSFEAIWG